MIEKCNVCAQPVLESQSEQFGQIRGNTARFKGQTFRLWKCPNCGAIHAVDPVDFAEIYRGYPLYRRRLDKHARGTMAALLMRLRKAGVTPDHRILDVGCGNGVFLEFLKEKGFCRVSGYDPYFPEFAIPPHGELFDCIVANDVIEHAPDPREFLRNCLKNLAPGGLIYIGTADSTGVSMQALEPHILRLHQPFHRVILTPASLRNIVSDLGLEIVESYLRSYMDTLRPFANYRFLDEFSKALDYDMDRSLDPEVGPVFARNPFLLFWAVFGYFFPIANEPAVIARNRQL